VYVNTYSLEKVCLFIQLTQYQHFTQLVAYLPRPIVGRIVVAVLAGLVRACGWIVPDLRLWRRLGRGGREAV
jgi:hypothetical protein